MLDIVRRGLKCMVLFSLYQGPYVVETILLLGKKVRLRRLKYFAQGHTQAWGW